MAPTEEKRVALNEMTPKECFVIMPISDTDGYPKGHFEEVYSELICPAVIAAGFNPTRADKIAASNLIHVDVISRAINAELCICDLSSKNPNVMFEYGIRQAFDKPTVLIKDDKTDRIFDLSGMRDIVYNSDLRIRSIIQKQNEIKKAIEETIAQQGASGQIFSLVQLLSLSKAAQLPESNNTPESAQFQIIQKQLSALQEMMFSGRAAQKPGYRRVFLSKKDMDDSFEKKYHDLSPNFSVIERDTKFEILDLKYNNIHILEFFGKIPDGLKKKMSPIEYKKLIDLVHPF